MTGTPRKRLKKIHVAIDGPAGVGKTTTARNLAADLGLLYVDTGAMYRALAVLALEKGISLEDAEACGALARSTRATLKSGPDGLHVHIDGREVTREIRTPAASDGASRISVHPPVRVQLVRWQRDLARKQGVVMEGRDIGTVVLPEAEAKVFLTASVRERALRRYRELQTRGTPGSLETVEAEIQERDRRDQTRADSPLRPAPDAVVLDCTALDAPGQLSAVRKVVETLVRMKDGEYES